MSTAHAATAEHFDAHGHKDHGHVIVSIWTLRFILTALLFCTLLTVGAAWAESWISTTFNVEIPQMVNVFVALSIAAVKTVLVVMFFMQLKYDNPLNSMIFIFTIMTVAFFLGFTGLDLGKRGTMDPLKSHYLVEGGTFKAGLPLTRAAEDAAKANGTYHAHPHEHKHLLSITDMGYLPHEPEAGSSPNRSRPVTGLTLPGFAEEGEGDEHGHKPEAAGGH